MAKLWKFFFKLIVKSDIKMCFPLTNGLTTLAVGDYSYDINPKRLHVVYFDRRLGAAHAKRWS